jgi:alpha-tubulin suppressor-like RCC1 family protein
MLRARTAFVLASWLLLAACQARVEVLRELQMDAGAPAEDAAVPAQITGCSACGALELCAVNRCVDTAGVTSLRSGLRHVCVVRGARLSCWGSNGSAQLGLGDDVDRLAPMRVGRSEEWLDVAAGQEHTCALHAPGELYCWGENSTGQLGLGDTIARTQPMRVGGHTDYVTLTCGGDNCCAVRVSGALYCWGDNHQGVPAQGDLTGEPDVLAPSRVSEQLRYSRVSVGEAHACAIDESGSLWCWGRNEEGQLGVGLPPTQARMPLQVGTVGDFREVAAGQHHTCAIRGEGELYCWGSNEFLELGIGRDMLDDARVAFEPVRVGVDDDWATVGVGWFHSCAIKRSGALYCWGRSDEGQLGGERMRREGLPQPTAQGTRFRALALGSFHTCALDADGGVQCWGANTDGQLGTGDTAPRGIPTPVSF